MHVSEKSRGCGVTALGVAVVAAKRRIQPERVQKGRLTKAATADTPAPASDAGESAMSNEGARCVPKRLPGIMANFALWWQILSFPAR